MFGYDSGRAVIRKNDPYRGHAMLVRQVCNSAGVPTIHIGYYLRFGRGVWSLAIKRGVSGDTLAKEVALRVAMWRGRGLKEAVLRAIHRDVFNVPIPTP